MFNDFYLSTNIKIGSNIGNNELLKQYDKDNNSIFSMAEYNDYKADTANLYRPNGSDNKIINWFAKKYNMTKAEVMKKLQEKNQQVGTEVADHLYDLIDDNFRVASVNSEKFEKAFSKINENNVLTVLNQYKKRSEGKESLVVGILYEKTSNNLDKPILKLFELLLKNIDKSKYDTSQLEKSFHTIMSDKKYVTKDGIKEIDKLFDIAISMAKSSGADGASEQESSALLKDRQVEGKSAWETQKKQGAVSRVLDDIAGAFGGITEENVGKALEKRDAILKKLDAVKDNPKEYAKVFKEIFGVEFSPVAVKNYEKASERYNSALISSQFDQIFESTLKDDVDVNNKNPETIKKETALLYKNLSQYLGSTVVDKAIQLANVNQSDGKVLYKFLQSMVKDISKMLNQNKTKMVGDKSLDDLKNEKRAAYHAAYGLENDGLIEAEEWVQAQNTRLAATTVGTSVLAIAGAMFTGGGSLALLSTAVILADPIGFTESATDADGMTKKDWDDFLDNRAEMIGWTVLGMGAGAVGAATANLVKLKGLSQVLGSSGKSLNVLLKSKNVSPEILSKIKKIDVLAKTMGISTEVALDLVLTANLQKEGLTSGDYIMSLAGAIAGSGLGNSLADMPTEKAVSNILETFSEANLSKSDAKKILDQVLEKVHTANKKINAWSKTETKPSGVMYSSIIPISPVQIEKAAKLVARVFTDGVEKLFVHSQSDLKKISKLKQSDPDTYNAVSDILKEITTRMCAGEIPSKTMLDSITDDIVKKYDVDPELCDYYKDIILGGKDWEDFEMFLNMSNKKIYSNSDIVEDGELLLFEFRMKHNLYSEEHNEAISFLFKNIEERIVNGEKPTKEFFESMLQDASSKYDVSVEELLPSLKQRMYKDKAWNPIAHCIGQKVHDDFIESSVQKFATAKNITIKKPVEAESQVPTHAQTSTQTPESKVTVEQSTTKTDTPTKNVEDFDISPETYKKYSYLSDETFFDSNSVNKSMKIMEDYEKYLKTNDVQINADNFDETEIYQFVCDPKYGLHYNDTDRVVKLIKDHFHKDLIQEINIKTNKIKKYGLTQDELRDADKVVNIIKKKMDNDENLTKEELEDLLYTNFYSSIMSKIENYIYDNADIKDFLNSITHRDVYMKYGNQYMDDEIDEAVRVIDKLHRMDQNDIELTKEILDSQVEAIGNIRVQTLLQKIIDSDPLLNALE